jgi:Lon-like protease
MRERLRRWWPAALALAVAVGVLAFWPLPYYVYAPWSADDLNRLVHVKGHTPPPGTLYDTSIVILPGRPASYLAGRFFPGFQVAPRTDVAPATMSDIDVLRRMFESQEAGKHSAEVVAARAAGLDFPYRRIIVITRLDKKRRALQCFHGGDRLVSVDGAPIDATPTLVLAAEGKPIGAAFEVQVYRGKSALNLHCVTASIGGKPRFGVYLGEYDVAGVPPINVTYSLPFYQSGGSTGLMFALQIYRSLTGADLTHGAGVAGTGVIDDGGNVGPIVGTRQKLIVARRKGASVFLVPRENYAEVRGQRGIRVIPVGSFNEAVNWLSWRLNGCPSAAADIESITGVRFADLPIGDVEDKGMQLPAGIIRLDYGHAACNLIRFWYFWNDRKWPLRVHFTRAAMRSATLTQNQGGYVLQISDAAGTVYSKRLATKPDALVVYFISNRPGIALWTSPATYEFVGFDQHAITFWRAQPPR